MRYGRLEGIRCLFSKATQVLNLIHSKIDFTSHPLSLIEVETASDVESFLKKEGSSFDADRSHSGAVAAHVHTEGMGHH